MSDEDVYRIVGGPDTCDIKILDPDGNELTYVQELTIYCRMTKLVYADIRVLAELDIEAQRMKPEMRPRSGPDGCPECGGTLFAHTRDGPGDRVSFDNEFRCEECPAIFKDVGKVGEPNLLPLDRMAP